MAFPNKALPVMHLQLAQPMAWDPRNHKAHCEVHPEFKESEAQRAAQAGRWWMPLALPSLVS